MITPIFTGTITERKLQLDNRKAFYDHLLSLEGKRVEVTVERQKRKRSNQQNKYLWGVCYQLISEYTGEEPEDIHAALKAHFSPKRVVGNVVIASSTRVLDTIDFSTYVEKVRKWAAEELSINIPSPDEVVV